MSLSVSAPVLWDGQGAFRDNSLTGVQADAIVVGIKQKPTSPADPTLVDTLQVKDRRFGTLYLNMTLLQWLAAANVTQGSPTAEKQYTITITGSPTSTVSNAVLFNSIIDLVTNGGAAVDPSEYTYASSSGVGTITFNDPISPTAVIIVLYHNV